MLIYSIVVYGLFAALFITREVRDSGCGGMFVSTYLCAAESQTILGHLRTLISPTWDGVFTCVCTAAGGGTGS